MLNISVLATASWSFGQSNIGETSGLIGQVTKCQLDDGLVFYVRENVTAIPSFMVSSSERWGDKIGKRPARRRQSLELAAPADRWKDIAELVQAWDPLKRPVLGSSRFSAQWAEALIAGE